MRKVIGNLWDRLARNYINDNFEELYDGVNNISGKITDEVYDEIRNDVKLNWKEPVDTVGDLPNDAETGDTRMVRESDDEDYAPVYRFDGNDWVKIQEINTTAIDKFENRMQGNFNDFVEEFQEKLDGKETPDGAQEKADGAKDDAVNEIMDEDNDVVKVVESGSNSNGHYVRYSDGTQHVWGEAFKQKTDIEQGEIYRSERKDWTYPKPFASHPIHVSAGVSSYSRWADIGLIPGKDSASILQFGTIKSNSELTTLAYAFGRWK